MAQTGENPPTMQVWKILWRREWLPIPIFLSGEFHGEMSLAGYNPGSHEELDTTEELTLSLFTLPFKRQLRICSVDEMGMVVPNLRKGMH